VLDHQNLYPQQQVTTQPLVALLNDVMPKAIETDIVIFHWLDFDCQCTYLGRLFVEQLTRQQLAADVKHIILLPPDANSDENIKSSFNLPDNVHVTRLNQSLYRQSQSLIPATPGAAILRQSTQSLSYLGPHSGGVACGSGTNLIELVVNNLAHGFDPQLYQLQSSGCFCSW